MSVKVFAEVNEEVGNKGQGNIGVPCATLKCRWVAWFARSETTVELQVRDGDCPDMTGCVEMAEELNEAVTFVVVREAGTRQIINVYERKETDMGGSWSSKVPVQDAWRTNLFGTVQQALSSLQPWQLRVIAEKTELDTKLEALDRYLEGTHFRTIAISDQVLLKNQRAAMKRYQLILAGRIDRF